MTRSISHRRRSGAALAAACVLLASACAPAATGAGPAPAPDARAGLRGGLFDAGQAGWNLRLVSTTPPPREFVGQKNTDLAFTGNYAIQGSYHGFQVWDISNPRQPSLVTSHVCPGSQGDVSVYKNLLFVSGEGLEGRLDCGTQGARGAVSAERLRGLRIFDITNVRTPRYVGNVQTCRGSHTNTLLVDPRDAEHVYVYISGAAAVRPAAELAGCSGALLAANPNTALFRIEVIKVPLADPSRAAIVSSPRLFDGLALPPIHGSAPEDREALMAARARGGFHADVNGEILEIPARFISPVLDSIVKARGGTGAPTAADSAELMQAFPTLLMGRAAASGGPVACHDITAYPAIGLAAGACAGHGILLDISNPADPKRIAAASDSNFAFWHSATFSNDGTKLLFSDEWGGGTQPKCRASDPREWGADAIFTLANRQMKFEGYYKIPSAQTTLENCVAHNSSLIPIAGRDVLVQSWYQGGISVVDWTDARRPVEIAYFDRGPADSASLVQAGSWSAYWYNGVIVSSEIARGLDVLELTPSAHLTQNEIDAAKSVRVEYLNPQGQSRFVWPATFALARSYVDQLERSRGLAAAGIASARRDLAAAEAASGAARQTALTALAAQLSAAEARSRDAAKLRVLVETLRQLAAG